VKNQTSLGFTLKTKFKFIRKKTKIVTINHILNFGKKNFLIFNPLYCMLRLNCLIDNELQHKKIINKKNVVILEILEHKRVYNSIKTERNIASKFRKKIQKYFQKKYDLYFNSEKVKTSSKLVLAAQKNSQILLNPKKHYWNTKSIN
jgi:hypothetical protein